MLGSGPDFPRRFALGTATVTKITDGCYEATGHTSFICDFSPPRTGAPHLLPQQPQGADFVSVAYNPGHSVRVDSAMLAAAIKARLNQEVVFTLATRDMNKLALQSHLLGAQMLGLENVIVLGGDAFSAEDRDRLKEAGDFTPSELIRATAEMNRGMDFRGAFLQSPTGFCIGAAVDLGCGTQREARLTQRKVKAGAHFLITQPIFDPEEAFQFQEAYARLASSPLDLPIFFGLQLMERGSVSFSAVTRRVQQELAAGCSGVEIALELQQRFHEAGLHNVYLVPSIHKDGSRNYEAAREFLAAAVRV